MYSQEFFLKQYIDIHSKFKNVLDLTEHLNENFPKMADTHLNDQQNKLQQYLDDLKKEEKTTYDEAILTLKKFENGHGYDPSKMSRNGLEAFIKLIDDKAKHQSSQDFIREMALVHIITTFNEFLKDTLHIAFFLGAKTKKMWRAMSKKNQEKTIAHLVEHDIKEAAVEIRKNFSLDLKKESDWKDFAECIYRRHIFIHNRGFPNQKYIDRTHYRGKNTKLKIGKGYLADTITYFRKYSDLIEEYFIEEQLYMVNITKKSNVIKIDLTKGGGKIIPIKDKKGN